MAHAQLLALGQGASLVGIAVGLILLLIRPFHSAVKGFALRDSAPGLTLVALGCFAAGTLGIVAWTIQAWTAAPSTWSASGPLSALILGGSTMLEVRNAALPLVTSTPSAQNPPSPVTRP